MNDSLEQEIVDHYRLSPHPEGGWYRHTFSSSEKVKLKRGERTCGSSIQYFLKACEHSSLHYLHSDEIWYFHFGSPVQLHLFLGAEYRNVFLGHSWEKGQVVQYLVESETIFGAELMENRGSLMSCSVCPGFDEEDFNWPCRDELVLKFPLQKDIIERLHDRSEKSSM